MGSGTKMSGGGGGGTGETNGGVDRIFRVTDRRTIRSAPFQKNERYQPGKKKKLNTTPFQEGIKIIRGKKVTFRFICTQTPQLRDCAKEKKEKRGIVHSKKKK